MRPVGAAMKSERGLVALIAGARPNFMKVAPLFWSMKERGKLRPWLIHTGQHYDSSMSGEHFLDLGLPEPDLDLGVGSGTHAVQTAAVMRRLESAFVKRRPGMVVVVGDVNSTLAGALVAVKMHIPVAHVEAGLRSFDRTMPEEINRVVTDGISDLLFTHCREADGNLRREGVDRAKIFFVGNVMIDTLDCMLPKARLLPAASEKPYGLVTLHRPGNVDDPKVLRGLFRAFASVSRLCPLIFPVHPRTAARIRDFRILRSAPGISLVPPMSYLSFLRAMSEAKMVLTDSGGIQEETTALGVWCLTLRKNTERSVTVRQGTNKIVGDDPQRIEKEAAAILKRRPRRVRRPEKWDGRATGRIVGIIERRVGR